MKYFKPELFVAFNSEDAGTANRAAEAWDEAVTAYDRYLKSIRRKLPAAVQKLSRLHLHDAAYLDFGEDSPSPENRVAHLTVRRDGQPLLLLYFLLELPCITTPITDRVFSEQGVHWLYDELELLNPGDVSHEILLSNGRVYRFRFHHLAILTIAADDDRQDKQGRRRERRRSALTSSDRPTAATA